jgi:hypothetical protein
MGMIVVKVKLFDKSGARTTELGISGRADMPTMRGAHDSGDIAFKLNRKGDYLMPVNVVMPGGWEVRLVFTRGRRLPRALKFTSSAPCVRPDALMSARLGHLSISSPGSFVFHGRKKRSTTPCPPTTSCRRPASASITS